MDGDLLTAVRSRLLQTPGLSQLKDVFLDEGPRASDNDPYPFAIISHIDSIPQTSNSHASFWEYVDVQVTIFSPDPDQVTALGREAFSAFTQKYPPLEFEDGYDMGRLMKRRRGPFKAKNLGVNGLPVYQSMFDCRILAGRDM